MNFIDDLTIKFNKSAGEKEIMLQRIELAQAVGNLNRLDRENKQLKNLVKKIKKEIQDQEQRT